MANRLEKSSITKADASKPTIGCIAAVVQVSGRTAPPSHRPPIHVQYGRHWPSSHSLHADVPLRKGGSVSEALQVGHMRPSKPTSGAR